MTPASFAKAIRAANLTNAQVAKLLCVSDRTVRSWLQGTRRMPAVAVELWKMKVEEMKRAERWSVFWKPLKKDVFNSQDENK